jgi:hypothetical protein
LSFNELEPQPGEITEIPNGPWFLAPSAAISWSFDLENQLSFVRIIKISGLFVRCKGMA